MRERAVAARRRLARAVTVFVTAALATAAAAARDAPAGLPGYRTARVVVGPGVEMLRWGRRDGDARLDLFALSERTARIWIQNDEGFPPKPLVVRLPGDTAFAAVGDLGGERGESGERVVVATAGGIFADGVGTAPRGAMPFAKVLPPPRLGGRHPFPAPPRPLALELLLDLDGDGSVELLVPVRGGFVLYARAADGGERGVLGERLFLPVDDGVKIDAGGPTLLEPLRLDMTVPRLTVEDVNGDGRRDVLLESDAGLSGFLHGPGGLAATPSFQLDLGRFAAEVEAEGSRRRDAEKLFAVPAARLDRGDVDGDGIHDYLVSAGRLLRVYFGARDGVDFSRPHTLLRFSSELRAVRSYDFDDDGRRDLVAVRFELPTLPRLIAAYFIATKLEFEVLGYRNEGGRSFARRPSRSQTLVLTVPALRDVIAEGSAIADRFLDQVRRGARVAAGDLDGDGADDGAVLDEDGVLRLYLLPAGAVRLEPWSLGDLLFDTERTAWELEPLLARIAEATYGRQREVLAGRQPARAIPLGDDYDRNALEIAVRDLNGDGRGDIVLRWSAEELRILLSEEAPAGLRAPAGGER